MFKCFQKPYKLLRSAKTRSALHHWANLFVRIEARTGIKQRDWLAKKFAVSLTNRVAEFLCSLRVARTNSPSRVKTHKLLQVCKQVVTNLFTSCQQVVFALLVPSLL